ncbi:ArsR family transcriptional regulator [Methanoregula sp.]|uniref:ArsR family transcriptional regulator n=1 Tax=Methanoregula sp. TaxID=2052170 RepID=UPI003563A330
MLIEKTIQIFTKNEEEIIQLLTKIGIPRNGARILVYFSERTRACSHDIEYGTGLRQPEVSIALKYLAKRGWVKSREIVSEKKGRPVKIWTLTLPWTKILDSIRNEMQQEVTTRLERVRSVWNYI